MVNAAYRTCPACGQNAVPSIRTCRRCGHRFARRLPFVLIVAFVALLAIGFLAYRAASPSPLAGAWREELLGHEVLAFHRDGTYEHDLGSFFYAGSEHPTRSSGRWAVLSSTSTGTGSTTGTMNMTSDELRPSIWTWTLSQDGNHLRLDQPGAFETTYSRVN